MYSSEDAFAQPLPVVDSTFSLYDSSTNNNAPPQYEQMNSSWSNRPEWGGGSEQPVAYGNTSNANSYSYGNDNSNNVGSYNNGYENATGGQFDMSWPVTSSSSYDQSWPVAPPPMMQQNPQQQNPQQLQQQQQNLSKPQTFASPQIPSTSTRRISQTSPPQQQQNSIHPQRSSSSPSNWKVAAHPAPPPDAKPLDQSLVKGPSVAERVNALQANERVRLDEAAAAALQRAFEAEEICGAQRSDTVAKSKTTQLLKDEELARQLQQQESTANVSKIKSDEEIARRLQLAEQQQQQQQLPQMNAAASGGLVPVGSSRVLANGNIRVSCGHCTVKMDVPPASRIVICALCGNRSLIKT